MSFLKKIKRTAITDRFVEEKLYEQVLREFESGVRRDGLWAKAFQKSRGDEQKASALYFEYRIQSIKDEAEIERQLIDQEVESIPEKNCSNPRRTKVLNIEAVRDRDEKTEARAIEIKEYKKRQRAQSLNEAKIVMRWVVYVAAFIPVALGVSFVLLFIGLITGQIK